jgi:putative membrane protein
MKDALEPWIAPLNTTLIVISGLFLILGYYFIRRQRVLAHRRSMLTATTFAALFLVVYVTRALVYDTKFFAGEGWVRVAYLVILVSHTILATLVGPCVLVTLRRALRGQYGRHKQIARITLPMWLYVVVTGWIVYLMLHQLPLASVARSP